MQAGASGGYGGGAGAGAPNAYGGSYAPPVQVRTLLSSLAVPAVVLAYVQLLYEC